MVPFSATAFRDVFRVFDVNVALWTTTLATACGTVAIEYGNVRWRSSGQGPTLKNPSTSVDAELVALQPSQWSFGAKIKAATVRWFTEKYPTPVEL